MRCPSCECESTRVVDTRPVNDDMVVRRRRECRECDYRFTTYERIEQRVRKRDGNTEPFRREKIRRSVATAFAKRPIDGVEMEALVARIVEDLSASSTPLISTRRIGETVLRRLEAADPVAFVRYASVHRRFGTLGDFESMLEELENGAAAARGERPDRRQLDLLPGTFDDGDWAAGDAEWTSSGSTRPSRDSTRPSPDAPIGHA